MKYISVIIPVLNATNTIERALASLISNKDFIKEVIIIDDGTTDDTFDKIDIFKSFYEIKVIKNPGEKGPGPARRAGILEATGDWITFLDADDCIIPSAFRYVTKELFKYDNIVLLYAKTIYYETGSFDNTTIHYSDNSCGGSFYLRSFLIENNLLPHESLFMQEDMYFNNIIRLFLLSNNREKEIQYYNYPTYEVHHDRDLEESFSSESWGRYLVKYQLIRQQYVTDFFKSNFTLRFELKIHYIKNLIQAFFQMEGLMKTNNLEDNMFHDLARDFHNAIEYYQDTFFSDINSIIEYYETHEDVVNRLYNEAFRGVGGEFDNDLYFPDFILRLDRYMK